MNSLWDSRLARFSTYAAGLLIGAALWEYFGGKVNPSYGAPLSATAKRFIFLVSNGQLPEAVLGSLELYFAGFISAVLAAGVFGLLMSRLNYLRVGFENYIMLLYATPMIAMVPFIKSVLEIGFAAKFTVVFMFGFFPVLFNTLEGGRSLKPEMIEVAKSFRSSEFALWRDLLIPHTVPFILTGLRQGAGRALVGVVAAEFLISSSGLGGLIQDQQGKYSMSGVFASIAVLTTMGLLLMWIGRVLENRMAAWRGLNR